MTINIITCMLFLGFIGLLKLPVRYDRLLSWLVFGAFAYFFYDYYFSGHLDMMPAFSFVWGKSQLGNISLDFFPSVTTNQQLFPIYFIGLLTVFNNNVFRYEERKSLYNSILIFNIVALSLLVCAQNYIQLITMIFVSDILGYMILKNVDSSRRYVIYNLFADMCLFMILAMACGKIHSLEMSRLLGYEQIGRHKDFVGLMTTLALCVKMGCFLFQSYLLEVCSTRFHRAFTIHLLFSPLVSILLLIKIHNLMQVSALSMPIFQMLVVFTFVAGIIGLIVQRNLSQKVVYLNMAQISLLVQFLIANDFVWDMGLSYYYIVIYLISQTYFKIYLYQNRENDVTKMLNFREINPTALKTLFIQMTFLEALFLILVYQLAYIMHSPYIFYAAGLIYLSNTVVFNHLYVSSSPHRIDYLNQNPLRILSFVFNFILIFYGFYLWRTHLWALVLFSLAFIILVALPVNKHFLKFYGNDKLQQRDLSKNLFFYMLVSPLTYVSRTFWLTIDVFLSEKIIVKTIAGINNLFVQLFLKINRHTYLAYFVFILLGLLIFLWAYERSTLS